MGAMSQTLSRFGIGASEIASIASMNPYETPFDVWLRKTGPAPDKESTPPMEWGLRLEPAIRQKYVDETKYEAWVPRESMFRKDTAWARATPDGMLIKPMERSGRGAMQDFADQWWGIVQCKNVGAWVGKE